MARIFLLSPANCGGLRARMLLGERARFDLARRLRGPDGAPLGEVFTFMSGLYFRGKLAYARAFATPPAAQAATGDGGVLVIVPGSGLWPADRPVTLDHLQAFAGISVSAANASYRGPLADAASGLAARLGPDCDVVLLGSIASDKYVEVLIPIFGERLRFPRDFVGRGDMSRGGLLLRCVAARTELDYALIQGAVRRGARPPKLPSLRGTAGAGDPVPRPR